RIAALRRQAMRKSHIVAVGAALIAALAPLATAAEIEIGQHDRNFSKTEITIKPGDKLIFKNNDDVTHNVFSVSQGMEFDIGRQAPGASSTVPFDREGIAEVRCSIHPKMKLIVTVKK